ncbi:RecX family transcriptional regulator [Mycoplasmatota bacterium]|nr:RecX family transcriptional regulator [Mycoplasmatota bacterium]
MIISQIKKNKNNSYELTISDEDKEHHIQLSEDLIIKHHLYFNKEINKEEFKFIKTLTNYSKIYAKTLNYIAFKMRTEEEVVTYLKKHDCSEPYLTEIIQKLKRLNYINDQLFSDLYVKNQFEMNKKGPQLIKNELLKKQIKEELIKKSLQYISKDMINDNIIHLICSYDKLNKSKSINKLKASILRSLLLKGYDYDIVSFQLNKYPFTDNNNDELLLKKETIKMFKKYQKKYEGYELKNRVIKTLLSKGFLYEDILNVLASINTEE